MVDCVWAVDFVPGLTVTGFPLFLTSASRCSSVFGFAGVLVSAFLGGVFVTAGFFTSAFFGGALVSTFFGGVFVITGFGTGFFSGFGSGFGSGLDLISGSGAASGSGSEAGAGAGAGPPARSKKVTSLGFGVQPWKDDSKTVSRMMVPCAMET